MACDPLELSRANPALSANIVLYPRQKIVLLALLLFAVYFALRDPGQVALILICGATLFYLLFMLYKLALVYYSIVSAAQIKVSAADIASLDDVDLPVYSVLVPLYHEAESLAPLHEALRTLDYPADKLDVQFLIEEDDAETRAAMAGIQLGPGFSVTLIPPSLPRTKPKACNIGLACARGTFLVIYDAEDQPERDQLKKAVAAFRSVPTEVICLQCKLNFYNSRQNWFTRWFTAEYSAWFDLSLPGLAALRAVIPLGGTSNHFRTAQLRALYGWDAYNVTEDCDLGVRIYRAGYTTRMLDSTTWEEACGQLKFWISQRTRWLKGYMQTYLVHTRQPLRTARELGAVNFCHFHLLLGGLVLNVLLNPIFWLLILLWFLFRLEALSALFPGPVFFMGSLCLFVGNFAFLHIGAVGCFKRRYYDLVKYALLAPPYWVLMSYCGWRALWQLFRQPFRWEKTRHGIFKPVKA